MTKYELTITITDRIGSVNESKRLADKYGLSHGTYAQAVHAAEKISTSGAIKLVTMARVCTAQEGSWRYGVKQ